MNFPPPYRKPPEWYWGLPLVWRQRYCRWVIWNWERLHRFFTKIVTRKFLLRTLPAILGWQWHCFTRDYSEGLKKTRNPVRWVSSRYRHLVYALQMQPAYWHVRIY